MKFIIIIVVQILFANCALQSTEVGIKNSNSFTSSSPLLANSNIENGNSFNSLVEAPTLVEKGEIEELDKQNEVFRAIPYEFKMIDFKNFVYPVGNISVRLKNGELEFNQDKNWGNGWLTFEENFFIDLTGDDKPEAVVFLNEGHCGGSCDGGAEIIYFYSISNERLKLLGQIESGSRAYGCSIKSFKIKNKEITIEQFGRCQKSSSENEDKEYSCKFCVKDLTVSTYFFEGKKLIKKSSNIVSAPEVKIMNYTGETYIIE